MKTKVETGRTGLNLSTIYLNATGPFAGRRVSLGQSSISKAKETEDEDMYDLYDSPWAGSLIQKNIEASEEDIRGSYFERDALRDISSNGKDMSGNKRSVIKVGRVRGPLKLPLNITHFECEAIGRNVTLDLSAYPHLKAVTVLGSSYGTLIPPAGLTTFEYCVEKAYREDDVNCAGGIPEGVTIDLSKCNKLEKISVGYIYGSLKLSPTADSLTSFRCGHIGKKVTIDLSSYSSLETIAICGYKFGTLILPTSATSSLTNFIYGWVDYNDKSGEIPKGETLDLSSYNGLETVWMADINGNLILPENVREFSWSQVGKDGVIDLTACSSLTTCRGRTIEGILKIPSSDEFASFKCDQILSDVTVDLSACIKLVNIEVQSEFQGKLILPEKLKNSLTLPPILAASKNNIIWMGEIYKQGDVKKDVELDLSGHIHNPKVVEVGKIWGTVQLSSCVTTFKCTQIFEESTFDLSLYDHITSAQIGDINRNISLPSQIKDLTCGLIGEPVEFNLERYTSLQKVNIGDIKGKLIPPPNMTEFTCGDITDETLDFESCLNLSKIKVGDIIKTEGEGKVLKLPSSLVSFECGKIAEAPVESWEHCTQLKTIVIEEMPSTLKLPPLPKGAELTVNNKVPSKPVIPKPKLKKRRVRERVLA